MNTEVKSLLEINEYLRFHNRKYREGLIQSIVKQITYLLHDQIDYINIKGFQYNLKQKLRSCDCIEKTLNAICVLINQKSYIEDFKKNIFKNIKAKYIDNNNQDKVIKNIIDLGKNYLKNQSRW